MHLDIFLKSLDAESISMIFRSNSSGTSFIAALSLLIAAGIGCLYFFNKEVTHAASWHICVLDGAKCHCYDYFTCVN